MKKIDKLLLKSFFGPFAVSFGIALFVLIMQFLWLYIDEIAGKGVSIFVMMELLGYLSISVFPMGLAIAILISSVMVMGGFSERYELSSMKSAGVSLMRVMRPLALTAVGVAVFSWICSNYLIPIANLQFKTRLYDIRKQKPALTLEAGVFNEDFRNFSIRIGKKSKDGESIGNIMIDDASQIGRNEFSQILADSGRMYTSLDKRYFVMDLHRGTQYQQPTPTSGKRNFPFIRTNFREYRKVWDMKEFDLGATDPTAFKDNRTMLSMNQLRVRVDSFYRMIDTNRVLLEHDLLQIFEKKAMIDLKAKSLISGENKPKSPEINPKTVKKPKIATKTPPKPIEKKVPIAPPPAPTSGLSRTAEMKKNFAEKFKNGQSVTQNLPEKPIEKPVEKTPEKRPEPPVPSGRPTPESINAAANKAQNSGNFNTYNNENASSTPTFSSGGTPKQTFEKPLKDCGIWLETFSSTEQGRFKMTASTMVNAAQNQLVSRARTMKSYKDEGIKTAYELYLKYCFAAICLVFMGIGAPLGAIIRKGGFGYSVVIAILFFMVFVTLYITCRKLAETEVMPPFWAAMMPAILLTPVGIWLTVKAKNDSQVFNLERYERFFRRIWTYLERLFSKKNRESAR
jgi:lipopolysaccharide export system permease protein